MNYKIIWQRFIESAIYLYIKSHIKMLVSVLTILGIVFLPCPGFI
ncbi:MAG: hypothetical protein PWR06_1974 [Thermoanaerobacteraceae bacterium]|nr:hypothetical protein [Thermoanaerobacteraceae bacterium]